MKSKYHFFDYASTTPMDKRVFESMRPFFMDDFGNPSNLYSIGHRAKKALAAATKQITDPLGCGAEEIVFTGSATESDNLAIVGAGRAYGKPGKIIISNVEHKGILSACEALEKSGYEIAYLKIGKDGLVKPQELKKMLDQNTIMVSVTYTDSETGTIQPIKNLGKIIKSFRQSTGKPYPYFHTDASQAVNFLDINVNTLGVDLMTLSAQKIYGPKGVGALYVRRGTAIQPIIYGGGQQNNLRSGTENIPGIVGFGQAMQIVQKEKRAEAKRVAKLRDRLEKGLLRSIDKVLVNGNQQERLPNFLNVSILDVEGESMLLYLDEKNIIVNTGSACNSQTLEPSYVLVAFGRPYEYIHGSLRFSLGKQTTLKDIDYVLKNLPPLVEKLRKISPLNLVVGQEKTMSFPKAFVGGQTPHFLKKKNAK